MSPNSPFFGLAIILATFLGPILAVVMTRIIDHRRDQHQRRLFVFRTLMATRRATMSPDHVNALNLIEVEFHGHLRVTEAWRAYLRHLSTPFDPKDNSRVTKERQRLLTTLLFEMTSVMNIKIPELDILDGGYNPQGVVDLEAEQKAIRVLLTEIAKGNRAFPVEIQNNQPVN
jgi:hypothetical protein